MIDTYFGTRKLNFFGIAPHYITLAGLFFGVLIPFAPLPLGACLLLALSGICDLLDGMAARATHSTSNFGCTLDIVSDRVVEFAVVMALYQVDREGRAVPCLWMLGAILVCVTSFLVVSLFSAKTSQKSFAYSAGLMERTEAFLFFFAMFLLPDFFYLLAPLFTALVFATALIRMAQFRRSQLC